MYAGSLEVGKLKLLCQRLFKVPAARQALFLKAGGDNPMPDNIGEDDSKDLMFFSIEVDYAASSTVSGAAIPALCLEAGLADTYDAQHPHKPSQVVDQNKAVNES